MARLSADNELAQAHEEPDHCVCLPAPHNQTLRQLALLLVSRSQYHPL